MDGCHSYRVFRGDETEQVAIHVTGLAPADPNLWYWEPAEYDGKILYSKGFGSREEAIYAAETSRTD
jgi:hypothetical protein